MLEHAGARRWSARQSASSRRLNFAMTYHGGYRITSHEKRRWGVVLVQSPADLLDRALRARRRSDADHPSRRELSLIGA